MSPWENNNGSTTYNTGHTYHCEIWSNQKNIKTTTVSGFCVLCKANCVPKIQNTRLVVKPSQIDSQFIVRDISKSHVGGRSFFIFHYVIHTHTYTIEV